MTLLSALLRAPALTGAVAPSSRYLAQAMVREAHGARAVIELGAGTGPVTRELVARHPLTPLTVVELQPALARKLARMFPHAQVCAQPAAEVLNTALVQSGPCVLVSSLPFRSLPERVREDTRASILSFLARSPGSWLVQFTYQPRAPFEVPEQFSWQRRRTVVANIPPAGVWVLRPTNQAHESEPKRAG